MWFPKLRTFVLCGAAGLCLSVFAQPPGGGPGGPGGRRPVHPVMAAIDANEDGELSAEEIANAPAALKKLDKNGDGKLSDEETRPTGGFGGPGGGFGPEAFVARMMESDADKDGKLSKSELPERARGMFDNADADKDGFLTKEELTKAAQAFGGGRGGRGPGGAGGPPGGGDRPRRPE